jgi:GntR family transcriptional regulator
MSSTTRPAPLKRGKGAPLWAQLEADLQRRMEAGAFDEVFPGEHELAEQYEVSRHTVREALRRMRSTGVVDSARGRGTSLRHTAIEQPLGALYSLFRSVESTGAEQRSRVRVLEVRTDAEVAERLAQPATTEFVFIERLRLVDSEPLALDRSWLPKSLAAPLLGGRFEHSSLYGELARLAGVRLTGGYETVRALVAPAEIRRLLAIRADTAVLGVERIGCLSGEPVEFRESLIRGDRFALTASWPGNAGYQVGAMGLGSTGGD